jgi:uncharacterized membrane protein
MWTRIITAPLFVCLITGFAVSQSTYVVTDLGSLSPTGINSWAQVVGNHHGQAYMWTLGHKRSLGTLPGGTFSFAAAVNDLDVVTGTADGPGTVISPSPTTLPNQECTDLIQPFLWTPKNGMQGLGTEGWEPFFQFGGECDSFYARSINLSSQMVGDMPYGSDSYAWGFLWTNSTGFALFGGSWQPTFVTGISNTGQIVGQNSDEPFLGHATSWKSGVATDLGSLLSSGSVYISAANGVNDLGAVVGWSVTASVPPDDCFDFISESCPMHAVLWTNTGTITDLGTLPGDTLSSATKINLRGLVIGSSGNTVGFQDDPTTGVQGPPAVTGRPFLWSQSNGMQDLNTLIPSSSAWVLNTATDINVWGQIVGEGTLNGQPHGFLLTPRNPF